MEKLLLYKIIFFALLGSSIKAMENDYPYGSSLDAAYVQNPQTNFNNKINDQTEDFTADANYETDDFVITQPALTTNAPYSITSDISTNNQNESLNNNIMTHNAMPISVIDLVGSSNSPVSTPLAPQTPVTQHDYRTINDDEIFAPAQKKQKIATNTNTMNQALLPNSVIEIVDSQNSAISNSESSPQTPSTQIQETEVNKKKRKRNDDGSKHKFSYNCKCGTTIISNLKFLSKLKLNIKKHWNTKICTFKPSIDDQKKIFKELENKYSQDGIIQPKIGLFNNSCPECMKTGMDTILYSEINPDEVIRYIIAHYSRKHPDVNPYSMLHLVYTLEKKD